MRTFFHLAVTSIAFVIFVSNANADITEVGYCDTPGISMGVVVAGQYAYIAARDSGVRVIDISDPENPFEAGACELGVAMDICVSGDYAFVASIIFIFVVDISNPEDPHVVGQYIPQGWAFGITATDDYVYVPDYDRGLCILDFSDPTNPERIGYCDTPGTAYGADIVGNFAYVADGESGISIINISNPQRPSRVGSSELPGFVLDIDVVGDYAYTANNDGDFSVVDISDPENPFESGHSNSGGYAYDVCVAGNYAFVAHVPDNIGRNDAFRVFDISDPEDPNEVEAYNTPGVAMCTFIEGRYAYVVDDDYGLRILDVSDYIPEEGISDDIQNPVLTNFTLFNSYPNPFNGQFSFDIQLPQADIVKFRLYDVTGRSIWSFSEKFGVGVHQQSVDLNLKSAGVYFLEAESSFGSDIQRVVMLK